MKYYKLFILFAALNIGFQMVSDITAGKIIELFGLPVSITVLYFPFVYIISDVMTEVYGYAQSRKVLWLTMLVSIGAGVIYQLVVFLPPSVIFGANEAYKTVFGIVPRVLIGGWVAVFFGDIVNNYILAKMKVWSDGKNLWLRTISSTIAGQFVNTLFFYVIALSGILPLSVLVVSILSAWVFKVFIEVIFTPVTYFVVNVVKRVENEDYYDRNTNFNPLSY